MTTNDEQLHIRACLQAIEARVNWGPANNWSNSDFENLADKIAAATGVQLSVSTLKRLWGKVASSHAPSLTTLHTLARYLDYPDWRTYQQQFRPPVQHATNSYPGVVATTSDDPVVPVSPATSDDSSVVDTPNDFPASAETTPKQQAPAVSDGSLTTQQVPSLSDGSLPNASLSGDTLTTPTHHVAPATNTPHTLSPPARPKRSKRVLITGIAALLLITIIGIMSVKRLHHPDPSRFSFSANKVVTEGVPNTVIFRYDAAAAVTDSNYIVQTWDLSRKTHIPKDKKEHSAIYYYPGFFRAKLIADGEVVQHHDLQISSNGWLALFENEPVPSYLKKEEYLRGDSIVVDSAVLQRYGLSLFPEAPKLRLFNQRDLGTLMNDHFEFETTLKSNFSHGSGACQFVQVLIQCKDDVIIIPLSAKACSGDLKLYACGTGANSKHADLSGFGADLNEWTTLHVSSKNRELVFTVNGKEALRLTFPNNPTGIVGLQYRFPGVGAIKDTWFRNGETVYDFGTRE